MRVHRSCCLGPVVPSRIARVLRLVLLAALALATPTSTRAGSFRETFSTNAYWDNDGTTADWNTMLGQLRLRPLAHPTLSQAVLPGTALDVTSDGPHAYVAAGSAGLVIASLTDPAAPVTIGSYDTPGSAMAVVVRSGRAFVADGVGGLQILDVSDPANPTLLGSLATPDTCFDVAVRGVYAYLALGLSGVQEVSLANPASPVLTAGLAVPGRSVAVAASAFLGKIFIASGQQTLYTSGQGLGGYGFDPEYPAGGSVVDVACDEAGVYVAYGTGGLQISQRDGFGIRGSLLLPGETTRIACADGVALVANSVDGLAFVNVRDTTNPVKIAAAALGAPASGIAPAGQLALVAEGAAGLGVVVKAAAYPRPESRVTGSADVLNDLCFHEGRAFGVGDQFLHVFRFNGQGNLAHASSASMPYNGGGFGRAVDVLGSRAYVAAEYSGLVVYDVSDDLNPILLATATTPGFSAYDVQVVNNIAYVSGNGLLIYDVTNPTPVLLSSTSYPDGGFAMRIDVSAKRLHVGLFFPQILAIYDVSNPAAPILLGQTAPGGGAAFSCAQRGNLVALANSGVGTEIFDIQNPASPVLVAIIPNEAGEYSGPSDVAFSGSNLVIGGLLSVRVFDVSNPATPQLVSRAEPGVMTWGLAVRGERVYAFGGDSFIRYAQVDQHFWDTSGDVGVSFPIELSTATQRMRVTATGPGGALQNVSLQVASGYDGNWLDVPSGTWVTLPGAMTSVAWRARIFPSGIDGATDPAIDDLVIDWRVAAPTISSVQDAPNDQGKQVRLDWESSALDSLGSGTPILSYALYRQIDPNLAVVQPAFDEARLSTLSEPLRAQVESMLAAGWDFLAQVPALAEDAYAMVVPTLRDSTIANGPYLSTFRVLALTASPGVNFASPSGSGYSLDNLAPSVPENLTIQWVAGKGDSLSWTATTIPDFQYYRVYRGTTPTFPISPATLVQSTTNNHWIDPQVGSTAYYKVTATDFAGNESPPAMVEIVTGVDDPAGTLAFALHANVPNPVVNSTAIRFTLPGEGALVALRIYDVRGKLVRTLAEDSRAGGEHVVTWDARDDAGHPVGAGVFFCSLSAPGHSATRKLLVVR